MEDFSHQRLMTVQEIIVAIRQLGPVDLEKVACQVTQLRKRQGMGLEAELLRTVLRRRPRAFERRYRELMGKRSEETLSEAEYEELLRFTDEAEEFELWRIKALAELADLRQTDPTTLMKELGLVQDN